jgi:hypothetical protein
MSLDETRIMALLEDILESNRTPEEACCDFPELLPIVRERLSRVRHVAAQVERLFPPRSGPNVSVHRPRPRDQKGAPPEGGHGG